MQPQPLPVAGGYGCKDWIPAASSSLRLTKRWTLRQLKRRLVSELAVVVLVPGQLLLSVPVSAAPVASRPSSAEVETSPQTAPGRAPEPTASRPVRTPVSRPTLGATPTDAEITGSGLFEEPLVPVGSTTTEDNRALRGLLGSHQPGGGEDNLARLEAFLRSHAKSPWRPALLVNLALLYRQTGRLSRSISTWEQAWRATQAETEGSGALLSRRIVLELARLHADLGQQKELESFLAEVGDRPLGSLGSHVDSLRTTLAQMATDPNEAFRCGPRTLDVILASQRKEIVGCAMPVTAQGTSLRQLQAAAKAKGLEMRVAKLEGAKEIPVPSLMHWKLDHFSPVMDRSGDRYLIQDRLFGDTAWVSQAVIEEEGSGYFLIPGEDLPKGWREVAQGEGRGIWGRGAVHDEIPSYSQGSPKWNPSCSNPPMAVASAHLMYVNLSVGDTPVRYAPAVGPDIRFEMNYNHRDTRGNVTRDYSNLGPLWTFDWLGWIEEGTTVKVLIRGGGEEKYSLAGSPPAYPPNYESGARIQNQGSHWERSLPDGSKELYEQQWGTRYYLTRIIDRHGNEVMLTYESILQGLRLTKIVDSLGLETELDYRAADPLLITKVSDPFDRAATFDYQQQNGEWRLVRITDVVGLQSAFGYDTSGFMTSLTTPYGTSHFAKGTGAGTTTPTDWLELTDPTGATTRVEYFRGHVPPSVFATPFPHSMVPAGFAGFNSLMDMGFTAVFDERAMAEIQAGGSKTYDKSRITYWALAYLGTTTATAIKRVEKAPLENPVWYAYTGQSGAVVTLGRHLLPVKVARSLGDDPDGAGPLSPPSAIEQLEYNAASNVIRRVDPVGRETVYVYGSNNIPDDPPATGTGRDLLEVRQTNPLASPPNEWDVLARNTYDSTGHILSSTDAAGQTTTYTYDSRGRLKTVMTPPRDGLSGAQLTATYEYHPDTGVSFGMAGRLRKVTGPSTASGSPTTSFEYDAYGRVRKTTDQEGYTVTTDYDAIDRPLKVTYPDGTYEETVYNRLDPDRHRDRLGRWSQTRYDARRRLVSTTDALGRTVTQIWCGCGDLTELVDANKNATRWVRDIQGRVVSEIRANGKEYLHTYEATTSRLKSVQDPKGQVKHYEYFADGNLKSIQYKNTAGLPLSHTPPVSFTYHPYHNRLLTLTDGTGTTQYGYHPFPPPSVPPAPPNVLLGAGRLLSVDGPLPDDTLTYGYDELGRVKNRQIDGAANQTAFSFDALGRLTTETNLLGSFGFTYQGATGRLAGVTYPNGQQTAYAYFGNSGDQRLQEIHHKQPGGATLSKFNYTYDAVGNIKTWAQQQDANPAKLWQYGYDAADQLTTARITAPTPLPTPSRYVYVYDPAGNRTVEQIDDAATASTYDNMNRLTSQGPGGSLMFKGTVSEPAQVTVSTSSGTRPASVTPTTPPPTEQFEGLAPLPVQPGQTDVAVTATDYGNPANTRTNTYRVSTTGTSQTFTYDANGNLTGDGTKTYEWDAENRLLAVKQGASTLASFTYNGNGLRATKTVGSATWAFLYEGNHVAEERLSTGGTIRNFHALGTDDWLGRQEANGTATYLVADHLGSIARQTTAAGQPTLTREYDPWGNQSQNAAVGGFAYTGREWDPETGLQYYRARYYDPKVGRFISEDGIGLAGGPNLYEYVRNQPSQLRDPWGNMPPPRPKPDEDRFCFDRYMDCQKSATGKAGALLAACLVFCALVPVPPLGKGACAVGCLFLSVAVYSKLEGECADAYQDCIKRYPVKPKPRRQASC